MKTMTKTNQIPTTATFSSL